MLIKTPYEMGLIVRDQRKKLGWTQDQLATRLGISRLWVVQMEKGKETVQLGLVLRTLNELKIPVQVDLSDGSAKQSYKADDFDLDTIIRETSQPYRV